MMTEAEAKTKWCPFARQTFNHRERTTDRAENNDPFPVCIASACMAWRWHGFNSIRDPDTGKQVEIEKAGFCGLAGKP